MADFGVALYDLYKVAKNYLPAAAETYGEASKHFDKATPSVDHAMFGRPFFVAAEFTPTDWHTRVHDAWLALAAATSPVLSSAKRNLEDTAHALEKTVDAYARNDEEAAASFNRERQSKGEPKPSDKV